MSELFDFEMAEPATDVDRKAGGGPPRPGFRLHKLEVCNWGTFDSTLEGSRGRVYTVLPAGESTLLIGANGSGKSTLVDAILTLLVHGPVRNYNVAAGAGKRERDERTYVRGAYGRLSRDGDGRAEVRYLRREGAQPSVLLACFRSEASGRAFTLAQVLHLDPDGQVKKVYCFAEGEKSIAADCAGLAGTAKLKRQMEERGFRVANTYQDYHGWFRKMTGVLPKAMDMFNQTVAVKDVHRLTDFIRDHMLEAKPWGERVDSLLRHFSELGEAHASLEQARRQFELLEPVAKFGAEFKKQAGGLERADALLEAVGSFFRQRTIDVLTPQRSAWAEELGRLDDEKRRLAREAETAGEECRSLKNEIERAGGERLREIPLLIQKHEAEASGKRDAHRRYHEALAAAGLDADSGTPAAFAAVRARLPGVIAEIDRGIGKADADRDDRRMGRAELARGITEDERELEALNQRQGNLPANHVEVRQRMCHEVGLPEKDLPFAAELIAVKPAERAWEPSVEMILRPFALSLLVPERHYGLVSRYINQQRLADDRGRGMKLTYVKVGATAASDGRPSAAQAVIHKLDLRERHPLVPWVRAELEQRFGYRCCDTIEEFQQAAAPAMTRERHVKRGGERHEKDDREYAADRRNFVLGWDNGEKRRALADAIRCRREDLAAVDERIQGLETTLERLREQRTAARRATEVLDFSTIDFASHDAEIGKLELEKRALEEGNATVRVLKGRLAERELRLATIRDRLERLVGDVREIERDLQQAEKLVGTAQAQLDRLRADGSYARHAQVFDELAARLPDVTPAASDILDQETENALRTTLTAERDRLRHSVEPAREKLTTAMGKFLQKFPDERADLQASSAYLDGFLGLLDRIRADDLPGYERRFKERLNEKVNHEIGMLNADLESERTGIEDRIETLNLSLGRLAYRPGTHMRLEARDVRDPEVVGFRESLKECLAGAFEGSPEADEARFVRIAKLVARLRDEERWRTKVTDVRRWFEFAARELDDANGGTLNYYEDSAGQSGGEKAKLAFTILVAAIAYQYDLDADGRGDDRFRFVVVDEMFSKVDDVYSEYALRLFEQFGLQLLIVAPLDPKARVTEPHVGCYLHVAKDPQTNRSDVFGMTAREFADHCGTGSSAASDPGSLFRRPK